MMKTKTKTEPMLIDENDYTVFQVNGPYANYAIKADYDLSYVVAVNIARALGFTDRKVKDCDGEFSDFSIGNGLVVKSHRQPFDHREEVFIDYYNDDGFIPEECNDIVGDAEYWFNLNSDGVHGYFDVEEDDDESFRTNAYYMGAKDFTEKLNRKLQSIFDAVRSNKDRIIKKNNIK